MEALKMQSTIYAPIDGRVKGRLVHVGDTVESKDLLVVDRVAGELRPRNREDDYS